MRIFIIVIFSLGLALHVPIVSLAAEADEGQWYPAGYTPDTSSPAGYTPSDRLINPLSGTDDCPSGNCVMNFLNSILGIVIRFGTVVVILMVVLVGFKFVTAQGNETKIGEAKKMLLWTVVGALILLGAQAISLGIQATVNALSVGG